MDLAVAIYRLTSAFPDSERYGLTAQMRRSAVSIPSNIAEGQARNHRNEFIQFLAVANGSLAELDTQLELAHRLGYGDAPTFAEATALLGEVGRLLGGLSRAMRRPTHEPG